MSQRFGSCKCGPQGPERRQVARSVLVSFFTPPGFPRAENILLPGVVSELGSSEMSILLTPFDLKRLESYANNMLDYHVVMDLLPTVAGLYFQKRLGEEVRLSAVQSSILLGVGLQRKSIEEVEVSFFSRCFPSPGVGYILTWVTQVELQVPVSQALALFVKVIRKISKRLLDIQKEVIGASIPEGPSAKEGEIGTDWKPVEISVEEELNEAGNEVTKVLRERQRAMIDSLDLTK